MSQAMSIRESQGTPSTSFLILLAGQKQHSVVSAAKLRKLNQKLLPSAFPSCTLPFTAKQSGVMLSIPRNSL